MPVTLPARTHCFPLTLTVSDSPDDPIDEPDEDPPPALDPGDHQEIHDTNPDELVRRIKKGNRTRPVERRELIHHLYNRRRFSHALEVSQWMKTKGHEPFTPGDHAGDLDLIGSVKGSVSVESFFNGMHERDKTEKTYGTLLNCYARECLVDKSLSHLHKMKEMRLVSSTLIYNDIMFLYTNTGRHEKVPLVLAEMKENSALPDDFSYRICINSYGTRTVLDGIEKVFKEMEHHPQIVVDWNTNSVVTTIHTRAGLREKAITILKPYEDWLEQLNGLCYIHLLSICGNLGLTLETQRIWEIQKLHDVKLVFQGIVECDDVSVNRMFGGLMKCGCFANALQLFDEMSNRDVITWSVVINGVVQSSGFKGGLKFFCRMLEEKVEPNECVFVNILIVCAQLVAMEQRMWVEEYVKEKSIRLLVRLGTALVGMYLKYLRYKEDINIMKEMHFDAYRFLISWLRISPNGVGKVKLKGAAYYNRLIDYLLAKGITPYAILYHDDLPDALAKMYKGLLSPQVVVDFADYADFCLNTFGDRVQNCMIFNEPKVVAALGYDGKFAPGKYTNFTGGGNLAPYTIAHHLILPHAAAVKRYREKYQAKQRAQKSRDFHLRCFLHPIIYGEYSESVQGIIKERLPKFSLEEVRMVKVSIDFVGINKNSAYHRYDPHLPPQKPTRYQSDWNAAFGYEHKGVPIKPRAHSEYPYIVPWGLYKAMTYVKEHHGNPTVLLFGNGMATGLKYFGSMTEVYKRSSETFKGTFLTSTLRTRLSSERAVMLQARVGRRPSDQHTSQTSSYNPQHHCV